ncbi:MAG: hypothetical protein ACR2FO_05415 [Actinomycetota bacterium]
MTLYVVDFNLEDDKGRIPAELDGLQQNTLSLGDFVMVEDEEGHRCKARVDELSNNKKVVFLTPIHNTWESPTETKTKSSPGGQLKHPA